MAKDKVEELKENKVKLNYEVEVALLGLMLVIISLIGLVNQGFIGSIITFSLVYLFGAWYQIPLFLGIFYGLYFLIKRKKPKVISNMNIVCFAFLIVFLAIASSQRDGATIHNCFTFYKAAFSKCHNGIHINILSIDQVGGGLIGYILYSLLTDILGEFMTSVVIVILVLCFAYFAFKNPVIHVYNKIVKYYESRSKGEKRVKRSKKKNKEESTAKEVTTHFLTFDIFTQKIFDEEENIVINKVEDANLQPDFEVKEEIKEEVVSSSINEVEPVDEVKEEPAEIQETPTPTFYGNSYDFDEDEKVKEEVVEEDEEMINEELAPSFLGGNDDNSQLENSNYYPPVIEEVSITQDVTPATPYMSVNDSMSEVEDIYSLLCDNVSSNASEELKEEVEANCLKINQKLEELNIKAKVSDYIIGPCVTRYEIVPEIGVKVSSIVNIQNDLKLALAAINLRMEAPIPGKSAIGIEVANKKRYPVFLKEVLEAKKDSDDKLLVAIGKNLSNEPVTISIDKMPHLLIAGATGSGKSVCINSIIMSLILRATPDEVKLILIDPKKVEMLPYANMPHLLCPVVIDPKKASNALKKVVTEMDRRYEMFANNGVRNIESYNKLDNVNKLYKLVVIIDELADLMLACSKEVEDSIQRITQLARAAGIYLIVATQRPSVDVITGVIKANIPSRIAFSVSSMVDSRTILDRAGAEDLLGKGDMLMDISGTNALNRVQGVLVSDEEIAAVVKEIKNKYSINFEEEFMNLEDDKKEVINNLSELENTNNEDSLYNDIKLFVIKNQKASTSLLQRYFSLGYARAARMMDRLEEEGIVSEGNGIKPREVLIKEVDEDGNNN